MFAIARFASPRFRSPGRPLRLLAIWTERARQRRALAELPPERLEDLGLAPAEARREALKPFWRA